jgi:hypothetical protein
MPLAGRHDDGVPAVLIDGTECSFQLFRCLNVQGGIEIPRVRAAVSAGSRARGPTVLVSNHHTFSLPAWRSEEEFSFAVELSILRRLATCGFPNHSFLNEGRQLQSR